MGHEVFSLWKTIGQLSMPYLFYWFIVCVLYVLKATAGQDKTLVCYSTTNEIN